MGLLYNVPSDESNIHSCKEDKKAYLFNKLILKY